MDIFVHVKNQKLKVATNLKSYVSGTQNFVRFIFNITDEWRGLKIFAQFCQNGVAYNQYLDENDSAYLPAEIKHGTCTLMLYGSDGDVVGTTNYITLTIDENILVENAESTEISESLYQQLVSQFNDLSDRVNNVESNSVSSELLEYKIKLELQQYIQSGQIGSVTVDPTLSVEGAAADAKVVGDQFDTIPIYVNKEIKERLSSLPISVSEDGFTDISGLRRMTQANFVKADNTITVTVTLEGSVVDTSTVTLDDNGYPIAFTANGISGAFGWEGF